LGSEEKERCKTIWTAVVMGGKSVIWGPRKRERDRWRGGKKEVGKAPLFTTTQTGTGPRNERGQCDMPLLAEFA